MTLFLEEVRHDVMGIGNGIFRNRKDAESGNSTRSRLRDVTDSGIRLIRSVSTTLSLTSNFGHSKKLYKEPTAQSGAVGFYER